MNSKTLKKKPENETKSELVLRSRCGILNGCFYNFRIPIGYFDRVDVQIIGDFVPCSINNTFNVLAIPKIGVNA